jgi:predicted DNA-binding transcriptional regulator AlpA
MERDFIRARDVIARYSIGSRTLSRWLSDETLQFPKPHFIRGRRYWDRSELCEWDAIAKPRVWKV